MTVKERIEHSRTRITKLVFPQDTNPIGTLYGGTAMKWMDEVAFLTATRFARRQVVTVSMDRVDFKTFLQICTDVLLQTTEWGRLKKAPAGEVGFHTFGDQVKKQILRDGVPFNMLVVGSSGLGKSTFVDTLFKVLLLAMVYVHCFIVHLFPACIPSMFAACSCCHTLTCVCLCACRHRSAAAQTQRWHKRFHQPSKFTPSPMVGTTCVRVCVRVCVYCHPPTDTLVHAHPLSLTHTHTLSLSFSLSPLVHCAPSSAGGARHETEAQCDRHAWFLRCY